MLTRELLAQVQRLEIKTRRLVNEIFSGQYGSVFRGQGMEFAEVREYVAGDDIRSIDWNVTARMGHPYVKKYMAEREMTVVLMVDASASMRFGTAARWKSELAAEVAAVLGFSAIRNNDKVGLCLFTDRVEKFVRPQKGRTHTLRLVRDILEFSPEWSATRMDEALRYLNQVVRRRAVVFLLSDFYATDERLLGVTHRRHDLIALQVVDPREISLPDAGLLDVRDAETGAHQVIDSSRAHVRQAFQVRAHQRQKKLETTFRRLGIDHIVLNTDRSFVQPLRTFFQSRVKRFR
jgi:uncharacterized protein (DUF58 family)